MKSVARFLQEELKYAGFDESRQNASYGIGPETVAAVMKDNPAIYRKDFFMTLNWWKVYNVEHVMSGHWGPHPDTIRLKIVDVCLKLSKRKREKICSPNSTHFRHIWHQSTVSTLKSMNFTQTLEASDTPINSMDLASPMRFVVIWWKMGPFPTSYHDITIFRGGTRKEKNNWQNDSLFSQVPSGKRLIGDSGYVGGAKKISTTLGGHSKEVKEYFAQAKFRQETINANARYKKLPHKGEKRSGSKGKMDLHELEFNAITVALQYDLENGNPLFDL
ncbi:hypothetical protein HJC23_005224 [Cyclotella cryptica]|uniref:DDE Tnp4 domain-containing protein n=1 Tax=Cyclotella cryptica TaxID=29204 RepID=A0ABD3P7R4_9STRA